MAAAEPPADLAAAPVVLRAGVLEVTLEDGALRWLSVNGRELVRGVYMAVRDPDWGTVLPEFTRYEIVTRADGFRIELEARNIAPGIAFGWRGTIEGDETSCRFSIEGEPLAPFRTGRIGLCVLHPPSAAGRRVLVGTPWGQLDGRFPDRVAAMSLFGGFDHLRQPLGRGELIIGFEGDIFEMEDQRNWSDASFKTYSTPLQHPWPRLVEPGQVIRQSVRIGVHSVSGAARRRARPIASFEHGKSGTLPPVGILASPDDPAGFSTALDLLRPIRPAHLRVALEPEAPDVSARLSEAAAESRALDAPLEIELIVPDDAVALGALAARLARVDARLVRVLAFDRRTFVTTRRVAVVVRDAMDNAGLDVPLGGGSRANFYELNLSTLPHLPDLPLDLLKLVSFPTTPQVHAVDDATVMENLEGVRATIRSARAIARGLPVAIGPATLRPLLNPSAADPAAPQPAPVPDARQSTPFAAAWTVGLLQVAVEEGLASLTCHQGVGAAGLTSTDGPIAVPFPLHAVLSALAGSRGQDARGIVGHPQLSGIEIGRGGAARSIVANLSRSPLEVALRNAPVGAATALAGDAEVHGRPGHRSVALGPYGVLLLTTD
jgi:D-apionolactonase